MRFIVFAAKETVSEVSVTRPPTQRPPHTARKADRTGTRLEM